MKWEHLPSKSTISMSKNDVEKLRGSAVGTFVSGMVAGAVALLVIQGVATVEVEKPDKPTTPISSSSKN